MRAMMGSIAIGLAAFLAGCDSQPHEQMDSDFKTLQARCEAFRGQNEALKANVETLRAENASLERQRYGVRTENEALKRQLDAERTAAAQKMDKLVKELAAAKSSAPAAAATVAAPPRAPPGAMILAAPAAAGTDPTSVAELEKTVADLEDRIKALQPKLGQARSKIMAMARATVDQPMVAPPGGKIENGQVYRREPYGTWPYDDYYYGHAPRYAPIGPAVKKGDFPSLREKEEAVRKLKEETLPMEQELKSLQDDLAAAKAKLAKLRTPPPSI